ncbi:Glycerol-3-phosphate dehydrogenase [Pseudoloma neurophilia]|uniref:Glycerol-3-phosphate dehydrogenase n=1 Tax=Pseudoloma neurophilia TaxID=146866 RepID=A0A0R0LYB9_9MICR|nr:Glycerol-3-phosphate dehydrogenase [Pseudoloma neurophilia]
MSWRNRILFCAGAGIAGYAIYRHYDNRKKEKMAQVLNSTPPRSWKPNSRDRTLSNLKTKLYDILVIGGGINGAGCALDGATRGLKVAMVEGGDFGQETSSKSTKLIHGGVRYLEQAFKTLDMRNLSLVIEALYERKFILDAIPYVAKPLKIMLPVYNRLMVPYFLAGLKMYDLFSWNRSLGPSHYISTEETVKNFPDIEKSKLKGSIVYYDGIHDDARTNLMVAITASYYGADVLNYCKVIELIKKNGIIVGAKCENKLTKEVFEIHSKCVISTVGPFTDQIKKMANKDSQNLVVPSSGIHLVVPKEYGVHNMGLLDPNTADGRVLFFIPWMDKTILGSTDNPCKVEQNPRAKEDEVQFILNEANKFLRNEKQLSKKKVLSAWSGIRPLVKDPTHTNTKTIARTHVVHQTEENLILLAGGKWTTYRAMAEDAINMAIKKNNLVAERPCITPYIKLLGSHQYGPDLYARIERELNISEKETDHLINRYGDRAFIMSDYKQENQTFTKLHENYLFSEEEVKYSIEHEMACKPADILSRRMRLGFIDVKAAEQCIDKVLEIFKNNLNFHKFDVKKEKKECIDYFNTLGLEILK